MSFTTLSYNLLNISVHEGPEGHPDIIFTIYVLYNFFSLYYSIHNISSYYSQFLSLTTLSYNIVNISVHEGPEGHPHHIPAGDLPRRLLHHFLPHPRAVRGPQGLPRGAAGGDLGARPLPRPHRGPLPGAGGFGRAMIIFFFVR